MARAASRYSSAACREFRAQLPQDLVFVFHLGKLAADFCAVRDDIVERRPVLALQAVDGSEPVFDFGQMFGRASMPPA